jgi:hypothetical protein
VVKPAGGSSSRASGIMDNALSAAALRSGISTLPKMATVLSQTGPDEGNGSWAVIFQGFEPPSGLDGALALIEHLREGR